MQGILEEILSRRKTLTWRVKASFSGLERKKAGWSARGGSVGITVFNSP